MVKLKYFYFIFISYDKIIELWPNEHWSWHNKGDYDETIKWLN